MCDKQEPNSIYLLVACKSIRTHSVKSNLDLLWSAVRLLEMLRGNSEPAEER